VRKGRGFVDCEIPRKENSPIFFFRAPPLPVSPDSPADDPTIDKNKRSGWLIKNISRVYPKKGEHAPGK